MNTDLADLESIATANDKHVNEHETRRGVKGGSTRTFYPSWRGRKRHIISAGAAHRAKSKPVSLAKVTI